ncbi:KPN_02809 family neutral zinc metallopeptidase [Thioclava nitratireducens]|uniref:KPN_02809 family neutral zinc metallopeptidase n=1 Tax=Thioclava nitratireducens TaxID=1915078 RepID=UPI002481514C|nr:neutral zinc metallopeptidase [Thioclava nitratireducens]WGT50110.1 neutral zinc metallopeptidase [Thioclava nitratireducens]
MQWRGRRGSRNIEDRRGQRRAGGGAIRLGGGGLGVVAIIVVAYFLGVDLTPLLDGGSGSGPVITQSGELSEREKAMGDFVSVTLADTEEVWQGVFQSDLGRQYDPAVLVLFSGVTQSPCGNASGATGPFYCPGDQKIYLDTAFFDTLSQQLGARGDFAAAYVVAHEVAHHVQDELGILGKVNEVRAQSSEAQANALSVRIELQADCFSGIWARRAEDQIGAIEPGDIAEAMNAAARIGDDTLQREAGRVPMPDSFTHGSSAQRQRWFERGYLSGELKQCDTFSTRNL